MKGTMGTQSVRPDQAAEILRHSNNVHPLVIEWLAKNAPNPLRVQATQLHFTASHLQLRIRDTSGGTICAQLLHGVASNVCRYDPVTQTFLESVVSLSGSSKAGKYRLIWPSEMDLMARLAGLSLSERWGGWHKEPFTADSTMHVSVYRRP